MKKYDILINADYASIYQRHIEMKHEITIVAALRNYEIPYGVLDVAEEGRVIGAKEKPTISHFVNTGMYVINPELLQCIPENEMYHMPDLVQEVMDNGGKVGIYPISEEAFWDMRELEELKRMERKVLGE